jgi:hypothetical protein
MVAYSNIKNVPVENIQSQQEWSSGEHTATARMFQWRTYTKSKNVPVENIEHQQECSSGEHTLTARMFQ